MSIRKSLFLIVIFVLLAGCAGVPVRPALKEDLKVPAGRIEGNRFMGIRYPFVVWVPSNWKLTMEFPDFMQKLGYDKPSPTDKEQTELYAYNPETKSNIQFDFTPAGPHATFNQEKIEGLVASTTGIFKSEIENDYGKGIEIKVSSTEPLSLKGVPFSAKKYGTYTMKGEQREQGWIYGFSEPYQIFILYMIFEKEGSNDREDLQKILDSFEVLSNK
jgi:hypothetical protein